MLDCGSSRDDLNKFPRDHCLPCAVVGQLQLLDHISCKKRERREGSGERGGEWREGGREEEESTS